MKLIHGILLASSMAILFLNPACNHSKSNAVDASAQSNDSLVWIITGSYSSPEDEGITIQEFNLKTGDARRLAALKGISNPSFLTYRPDLNLIYSVGEDSGHSSTINVVSLKEGESPSLKIEKTDTTGGGAPCYIALTPDLNYVLTANYLGGSITAYQLDSVGYPVGKPQIVKFPASDHVNPSDGNSHLHSINFTNNGKRMIAANLGTDRLHQFNLQESEQNLDLSNHSDVKIKNGNGPRHIDFSADGRFAYLIGELSGEVCVLEINDDSLTPVQYIASDSVGGNGSGDIHLSPDGRFLYASNRLKADGISIFSVDKETGKLTKTGYQLTGPHPRNFAISPDGNWMLVACRDSDAIEIYGLDHNTGQLIPTDKRIYLKKPVCVRFISPTKIRKD